MGLTKPGGGLGKRAERLRKKSGGWGMSLLGSVPSLETAISIEHWSFGTPLLFHGPPNILLQVSGPCVIYPVLGSIRPPSADKARPTPSIQPVLLRQSAARIDDHDDAQFLIINRALKKLDFLFFFLSTSFLYFRSLLSNFNSNYGYGFLSCGIGMSLDSGLDLGSLSTRWVSRRK